jgi:hypothetical protein
MLANTGYPNCRIFDAIVQASDVPSRGFPVHHRRNHAEIAAEPGRDRPHAIYAGNGDADVMRVTGLAMAHMRLSSLVQSPIASVRAHGRGRTLQFTPLTFDVAFQEIVSTLAGGYLI